MNFTYSSYKNLLDLIKENGYSFCDYHNYSEADRCAILRHDVDDSLMKTIPIAEIESELGAKSTWFVLLRNDMYNPLSSDSIDVIKKLQSMGHEIGLHFDETLYNCEDNQFVENVEKELAVLSDAIGTKVSTVSMHRPSKKTLEANYVFPDAENSYSKLFFTDFKYVSDSRRNWREPVEDLLVGNQYAKFQILTHAFWYDEVEKCFNKTITDFINSACSERYEILKKNISNLPEDLHFNTM